MSALEQVVTLQERTERIIAVLEGAAIDVGQELLGAKRDHPGEFMAWVERELPFGIDRAERMMAVTRAFTSCDPEVRSMLPAGWTVLFELSKLPSERLYEALESGEVRPDLTVLDARQLADHCSDWHPNYPPHPKGYNGVEPELRLTTDIVATELLRLPRSDLSPSLEMMLREWVDG